VPATNGTDRPSSRRRQAHPSHPAGKFYAKERAILADAGDFADPFGLTLLEITSEPTAVQRNFIANQLVGVFQSVLYRGVPEAFGPMFGAYFRSAIFLLMEAEGKNASLADFDRVFAEPAYRRSLLERCADPQVVRFWKEIATKAGGEAALENIAPYICSKLTQFTGNPLLRPIITAPRTNLDFPGAMHRGDTVLVNLAKGLIGEHDSALLGGLITIRIFCAAMARSAIPADRRRPVRVYLDEFATYATGMLVEDLDIAGGPLAAKLFGVLMVFTHQVACHWIVSGFFRRRETTLPEPLEMNDRLARDVAGNRNGQPLGMSSARRRAPIPSWRLSHTFAIAATSSDFRSN
jgi:hypothetical protein